MCFEIIELRDLKCDLFQAFLAKFSQTKKKNLTQNNGGKMLNLMATWSRAGKLSPSSLPPPPVCVFL